MLAGIGIDPEKMAHIFDAFAQVQDGQTTGTGLGLFGVRSRAQGLRGSCGARPNTNSITGTGTVLWFTIPYVPDGNNSPGLSTKVSPSAVANQPTGSAVPVPVPTSPTAVDAVTPLASLASRGLQVATSVGAGASSAVWRTESSTPSSIRHMFTTSTDGLHSDPYIQVQGDELATRMEPSFKPENSPRLWWRTR